MDTSLYSMGAYFSDEHPDLVGEVIAQSEAIERAGLRAYAEEHDMTLVGVLRDAAHGAGRALLQRGGGVKSDAAVRQENLVKAKAFIDAYNRRDFDAAVESFDPLVEWVLPERQSADSCVGPARIRRFWEQLDEHMEELQLLPQEHVEAGDRIATRLRHYGRGKGSGVELDQELYHQVITFREGRMVRIEYFAEWDEALAAVSEAAKPPPHTGEQLHGGR